MLLSASVLLLGLVRGVGHALEPDHLAAVSTLVADSKGRRGAGLALGAAWGLGHTITLVAVGGALFVLRARMPEHVERALELGVAAMLVALGARALVRAYRAGRARSGAPVEHAHRGVRHAHGGPADHLHVRGWTFARRPLLVGLVHGLAGSGALTAVVVAELPSAPAALAYMLLFGLGSSAGMAAVSGVAGLPLARAARSPRAAAWLLGASGALSLGLGLVWAVVHALRLVELGGGLAALAPRAGV